MEKRGSKKRRKKILAFADDKSQEEIFDIRDK